MPYAYDTRFTTYSGQLDIQQSYAQSILGMYNYGSTSTSVDKKVETFGYPFPYAKLTQSNWDISQSAGSGSYNLPGYSYNIQQQGSLPTLQYDPGAFTLDLGLAAYNQGISNFWKNVLQR